MVPSHPGTSQSGNMLFHFDILLFMDEWYILFHMPFVEILVLKSICTWSHLILPETIWGGHSHYPILKYEDSDTVSWLGKPSKVTQIMNSGATSWQSYQWLCVDYLSGPKVITMIFTRRRQAGWGQRKAGKLEARAMSELRDVGSL